MHTCAKFWTRNAAVQSVRTPRQVLNPDFEKNMAKNWQSSGSPAGLMALRRVHNSLLSKEQRQKDRYVLALLAASLHLH